MSSTRPEDLLDKLPRSVYAWSGLFVLFTAFAVLVAPFLWLLQALGLDRDRKLGARFAHLGFRGFLAWCTPVGLARVRGLERLAEAKGPFVFVANHESNLDICLAYAFCPPPLRLVAKGELRRVPIVGAAVDAGGSIWTGDDERSSVEESVRALGAGASVFFFAEGTRSRGRGIRRFRKGAFEVARASQAPVVPVVVVGSGSFMPAGGILPMGRYHVTFELLAPRPLEGDADEFRKAVRAEIAAAHARIAAEPFHLRQTDGEGASLSTIEPTEPAAPPS